MGSAYGLSLGAREGPPKEGKRDPKAYHAKMQDSETN
jgi:hypothetical protein